MRTYWTALILIAALAVMTACETVSNKPEKADADDERETYTPPTNPRPYVPNTAQPNQPINRGGGAMFSDRPSPPPD